jgi:hypothetical protein
MSSATASAFVRVELKICEGLCGRTWFRCAGNESPYCPSCVLLLAAAAAKAEEERQKPVPGATRVVPKRAGSRKIDLHWGAGIIDGALR